MNILLAQNKSFDALWKEVREAQSADLPKSELQILQQIVQKAEKERAYGQLMKARLMQTRTQATISGDSLQPELERLQQQAQATTDVHLQAVCYAVLGRIYQSNKQLDDNWQTIRDNYFSKAMEHPAELAAVTTDGYKPFVLQGKDSQIFGNDLLSLIGQETGQYRAMYEYYMTAGNRRAQLMSKLALLGSEAPDGSMRLADCGHIHRLDSLADAYADLPECGEVAIARYEFMAEHTDATAEQQIAYIDEALGRWGSWQRMNVLRNARRNLTARQFNATLAHRVWIPDSPQQLLLQGLRGIDQITINIYKVKIDGDTRLNPDDSDDYKKLKPLLTHLPEQTLTRTYTGKQDYELFADTLQMGALPVGVYMMEVATKPNTSVSRTLFFVSNVRVIMEVLPDEQGKDQLRYVVVNATTGKPLAGAKLRLIQQHYRNEKDEPLATLTCDSQGEAVYRCSSNEWPFFVFATTATDRACPELNKYGHFSYYASKQDTNQTAIYTDRTIYRPGQTVHVAAICYETRNGFEHEVRAGRQVTATLLDANYKVVEEKRLVTDGLGTVSTDFILPATGLTGEYKVQVDNQSLYIHVEEYKRPTFQVEFPTVEQQYKDGDTLTVRATARTYSGVPVQGARVRYSVERRMAYWWFNYYRYWQGGYFGQGVDSDEIFSSEAVTSDDGTFEVQVPMVLPQSLHPQFYNFVVKADVTDQGGETHHGELSLPLGNRDGVVTADLPEKVLAEDLPRLKLHLLNAAGNDVSTTIRYQIDGGKWLSAPSNTPISLPKLKSGKHLLQAECDGKKTEREFVVFSLDDKRPAIDTDDWYYVSARQFASDGKPVTLQVGASGEVHIVYTLLAGNSIVEQGAFHTKDELVNRKLTYKPEYGNGLTLSFAWVRNGKVYTHAEQIRRPLPDKQLKMKWETFRDRLKPGQQEEWTLKIEMPSTSESLPPTSLIATLYDKSLDQIVGQYKERTWTLEPYIWLPMASLSWEYGKWETAFCYGYKHEGNLSVRALDYNRFDSECFPYPWLARRVYVRGRMTRAAGLMAEKELMQETAMGMQKAEVENAVFDSAKPVEAAPQAAGDEEDMYDKAGQQPEVRTNLQETAFFYPQLLADSTGRVSLKFTLPESLTTWRFLGIAHTRDMMHGSIEGEVVAQKDVMIQPNVPRFLRMGDQGTVAARIFNMTEREKNGTVHLQIIDPESGSVIYADKTACQLPANGTASVSFRVDVARLAMVSNLVVCKVSVVGETFSDGEQHYLPILSDREHVTVTVPFTQNEPGTKTIDLTTMFGNTAIESPRLTVEYTNNPAWLMVQALHAMGTPHDNCAVCQATAFYANSIGRYILSQNPNAKHVFESWRREQGNETSLMSALEKDQELKDLLLNETPWVMDADAESAQKKRIADFFDTNLMDSRRTSAFEKMNDLQRADGSWSWWKDMPGSVCMTVGISETLVRLNQMVGQQKETEKILDKAFRYMGKHFAELVKEMKKEEKKGVKQHFPSFMALEWLYVCALDSRTLPADVQKANNYLKELLKKDISRQTIYEKALSAIILNSKTYVKSLKEYTVYKEEMGRYYDTQRASYSWRNYRIPTQVAAIEALQRLTPDDRQTIAEMQRWLLQEKRTQAWDTPLNSTDAVYAFLMGNQSVLSTPKTPSMLKIDGAPIETSQATAGIGYVKASQKYNGERTFTAEKSSTGTSWGAVYAQFLQPATDIREQHSGLNVRRELFTSDHAPIDAQHAALKVGDRIKVRITIEADRDYDFVQVVDKRAACMEPVSQLSGYHWGYYCAPKDCATNYYFDRMAKGKHVIETEYYIDREGEYTTGTCTAQCAYSPEFRGNCKADTIKTVK